MSDETIQVFLSYAHDDDVVPPGDPTAKGFVSTLLDHLQFSLKELGNPKPRIWRDTRRIDNADQFDAKIEDAIKESSLFVVVLSQNWMDSAYCNKELKVFAERWREDPDRIRERIVVLNKRSVAKEKRPSLLQGQVGFSFFAPSDSADGDLDVEYFKRGMIRDDRFHEVVEKLAAALHMRVRAKLGVTPPPPLPPVGREKSVYVAKPSKDMENAYVRLVAELKGSGYAVFPDAATEIPRDSTATAYIDDWLSNVDFSIHLLGEKSGFAPEDSKPIVELQLARAEMRIGAPRKNGSRKFTRLIWAPKLLDLDEGQADTSAARNPMQVLNRFGKYIETDAVEGNSLSKFIELVKYRLMHSPVVEPGQPVVKSTGQTYVFYRSEDADYGFDILTALKAGGVSFTYPSVEGSDAERLLEHRKLLRDCDSVVICWAAAPDVWVKAVSNELVDWQVLGRSQGFVRRGLVAGPPPGRPKKMFVQFAPKDEMDVVLDLTERPNPGPEDISPLYTT